MTKLERTVAAAYHDLVQNSGRVTATNFPLEFRSGFPYRTEKKRIVDFTIVEKIDGENAIVEFYVRFLDQKAGDNVLLCSTPFWNADFVIPLFATCAEAVILDDY